VGQIEMFHNHDKTVEQILDTDNYDEETWEAIATAIGPEEVWKAILKQYPRYPSMIYNYINKVRN
jgi:hypothetical protein